MFCTFTTDQGALIIRTEDLRRLEDQKRRGGDDAPAGCVVVWVEVENSLEPLFRIVQGTARENLDRLRAEELESIDKAQRLQQRQSQGLPALPVPRGTPRG